MPQNLIPDSSFENNKAIPVNFSGIGYSNSWNRAGRGTTDLFCECDKRSKKYSFADVPQNAMGYQYAHSGKCYAGFFLFSHGDYREYLQSPISMPLEKGKTYIFSMYVSLANYSRTTIDQIGVCFTEEEKHYETGDVITDLNPVYMKADKIGRDTSDWFKITAIYKAKGGEAFLIIGSYELNRIKKTKFSFPKNMKTPINKTSERDAYYLVDDVSLIEWLNPPIEEIKKDSVITINSDTLNNVSLNANMVLKNVLFETNKATVLESSYPDLDKLVEYLKTNPEFNLKIIGHTDNNGDKKLNMKLSGERAKQVAEYLVKKGVDKKRLNTKGYGDNKPLFTNDTEEHKALNRRVEIIFSK
ncbi:MAG TPA: OmpA family protein [Bacteroidia bacterium]|nr:OmpA family protein [Bacteroidia bacterium]